MKESWLYYDYLRRWWWLLLMGPIFGGVFALGYYLMNTGPSEYTAKLMVAIVDPRPPYHDQNPPAVLASLTSDTLASEEAAVDSARSMFVRMAGYTNAPVEPRNMTVYYEGLGTKWWQNAIFGSVVGILLAIGGIYVWEDASAYQRHRQQSL